MKRILVCGGRGYGKLDPKKVLEHPKRRAERRTLYSVLGKLAIELGTFQLIEGGATGADALAREWCRSAHAFPAPLTFKADWDGVDAPGAVIKAHKITGKRYNAAAGMERNKRMLAEGKPDLIVAFPGGAGTENMKNLARKAGVEVREIT